MDHDNASLPTFFILFKYCSLARSVVESQKSIMEFKILNHGTPCEFLYQRDGLRTPIIESFIWLQNTICKVQTQIPILIVHSVMLVEASQRDGNSYESNKNYNKRYLIRDVIFP